MCGKKRSPRRGPRFLLEQGIVLFFSGQLFIQLHEMCIRDSMLAVPTATSANTASFTASANTMLCRAIASVRRLMRMAVTSLRGSVSYTHLDVYKRQICRWCWTA